MARRPRANRVAPSAPAAPTATNAPAQVPFRDLAGFVLLMVVTLLAYLPALRGELIMDDVRHVTRPELRSLHGLWRTWFDLGATAQYYPFLHSAFWVEHQLWGDSVLGYHLVNVLLHGVSACLVVMIVRRLGIRGAWLAGAIFALHPVCVNSVAWISEQKSTLSTVLYLGAGLTYLNFDQTRRKGQYSLAFALFVLALLSKTVTATLPAALLVVLWWKRGKLDLKRDVQPMLPWIAAGVGAGLFTAWVERKFVGAEGPDFTLTFLDRFLVAGRVIWFYFAKLVLPINLMFIYPHWKIDAASWWQYLFPLGVGALALIFLHLAKRNRGPLAVFLFFVGTLVPVLGFLNVYPFLYSYVSDHFQYLAMLGVIVPLASVLSRQWRFSTWSAGAIVLILGLLTWREADVYKDPLTLYTDTLNRNPDAWVAHNNLGVYLLDLPGHAPTAAGHFEAALQIKPDRAELHHNLGGALLKVPGRLPDAISEFQTVVRLKPQWPEAHDDLGRELAKLPGHLPQAIAEFNTALQLNPNDADAHANLGVALSQIPGKMPEEIAQFEMALRVNPDSVEAHNGLGRALASAGRLPEAISHFETALRIDPASAQAHNNMGSALTERGQLPEATSHFETALRLQPDLPEAHMNLGNIYYRTGRWPDAAREYEALLRLTPNYPEAEDNLGITLLNIPDRASEAPRHFEAALRNDPQSAEAHTNLGILLANAGRLSEAISHLEAALRIRPDLPEARQMLDSLLTSRR